jgi:ATP-binding cassette subfamily F protein 1
VLTQTTNATHNAVKAEDLSIFIGSHCLLASTELKIAEQSHSLQTDELTNCAKNAKSGACYGLVGVNGCGKSTLLKLIAEGKLPVPPSWNCFLVSQHLPTPVGSCPVEEVLSADAKRLDVLREIASLEEELVACSEGDEKSVQGMNVRLQELHTEVSMWDGAEKEIIDILVSLGFRGSVDSSNLCSEPSIRTPMGVLSGGWRMKVQLAKALWLQPKLMLLDEPSNHLDFQALEYLEERLKHYPHTIVVVSHDVAFLHNISKDILWIRDQKIESLPRGTVSQEDLLRMQRRRALNIRFSTPKSSAAENEGLSFHGVEFSYGESKSSSKNTCLLKVKKEIRFSGKSRSVLLGRNGSGKSTFLDLCAGKLSPDKGCIDRTPELKVGHYSQLTDELDRNSTDSAATYLVRVCSEELAAHGGSTRSTRLRGAVAAQNQVGGSQPENKATMQKQLAAKASAQHKRLLEIARGYLTSFGFEGDVAVSVPVDRLSGGQKALLKFAVLSLRPVHILLLDEPTNHLDAEACESLAKGLSEFEGGVVAVTHDELLMYRLIHCNWTSSELLICRGGSVWCERNFGAHCLNALKNEVHRAENGHPGMKPVSDKKVEALKDSKQVLAKQATQGELPPWLRSRRRKKDEKDDRQSIDTSAVKQEETTETIPSDTMETSPNTYTSLVKEATIDDIWDVVDSDATTEAPDASDGVEMMNIEADDRMANCTMKLVCEGSSAQMPSLVAFDSSSTVGKDSQSFLEHGRHGHRSRFRKDLVNLNKAVKNKMQNGSLAGDKLIEFIKTSAVAKHLRTAHGESFDENRFVVDVLNYATKKDEVNASV